jgi:hypothetical protein
MRKTDTPRAAALLVLLLCATAAFGDEGTRPKPAGELERMSFGAEGTYYEDSDRNRRHDEYGWATLPLGALSIAAEVASHSAHDSLGNPSSQQALVGVDAKLPGDIELESRFGLVRFDGDTDPAGRLVLRRKGSWGEANARLEYAPLSETAAMIRNHITFAGLEIGGKAALAQRVRPALRARLRDYSDDNRSLRLRGDLPFAVLLDPVRWEVGYRQEYATFERQSGSGYFDPSQLHSFQAVTSLSYWSERFEAYGEIFGGLQKSRRYGNSGSDGFYGLYLEASVSRVGPLRVALTAEGGDYTLGSAGGFRHLQAGLRISNNP